MKNRNCEWAAIFDFDGVIIDSSLHHERSWEVISEAEGLRLPKGHFQLSFGKRNVEIIPNILNWSQSPVEVKRLSDLKETAFRELVRQQGIQALPGLVEWLKQLNDGGIPCVIGTATPRENVDCILSMAGLEGYFQDVVAADDVQKGKPDPEVFLIAATRAGVTPENCVVFEDTPVGIAAAKAGGMRRVGVLGIHPREAFPDVDEIVERLDELSLEKVAGWFAES
jgi:beta-phosphoglucomutase family hydrolase